MSTFQPADNLRSRTYLGLLVAQFLAAFNDQAIHASSMFFAINQQAMTEAQAISLMPILFYAPWALFCTIAGYLADRYSKRTSLVFWKVAEVGITLIALLGFWLGTHGHAAGPYLVLSTVFLMGTHSAFFVPAKYGAMPEILTPRMLSRGNGVLESLSFLAVILGTVCGGILSFQYRGQEWIIGIILTVLAVIGALASLFIRRMPAANPTRPFPPYIFQPLYDSIRTLLRSRPLAVSVVGIAFFTFLVAFMRATVYMHGQCQVPPWSEAKTSYIVGMVALGIGLGSPLVGFLSGGKVELGLVPIGAIGMTLATVVAAIALDRVPTLIVCIILIGFFTGFYIVPLFTLLQHRAPKTSKGDSIATSNFINVTGAIIASVVFFGMDWTAKHTGVAPALPQSGPSLTGTLDEAPEYQHGRPHRLVIAGHTFDADTAGPHVRLLRVEKGLEKGDEVVESTFTLGDVTYYRVQKAGETPRPIHNRTHLPQLLFLSAGFMTLFTLFLLWWQMPDLFQRMLLWLRIQGRFRLELVGMSQLPSDGPVVLVTDAAGTERCMHVISATDRTIHFLLAQEAGINGQDRTAEAEKVLRRGTVLGLSLAEGQASTAQTILNELAARHPVPVLPVHYEAAPVADPGRRQRIYVVGGALLPPGTTAEVVRSALHDLTTECKERGVATLQAEYAVSGAH